MMKCDEISAGDTIVDLGGMSCYYMMEFMLIKLYF